MKNKQMEHIIIICTITVFMGQLYLNPVSEWFRFSLAVIALPLPLLHYKNVSSIAVSSIIGILMFLFRSFVHSISYSDVSLFEILIQYLPVIIYYLLYGILFKSLKVRNKVNMNLALFLSLWICDSSGNVAEALMRSLWQGIPFEEAVLITIIAGLLRSIVTYIIFKMVTRYKNRFEREQRENKFKELLLFTAKLKSELFFLKKSMHDIEDTMTESYDLYEKLNDIGLKDQALNILHSRLKVTRLGMQFPYLQTT